MFFQKFSPSERLFFDLVPLTKVQAFFAIASDPEVNSEIAVLKKPYQLADAVQWIQDAQQAFEERKSLIFGVFCRDSQRLIGNVGLHSTHHSAIWELGYWLAKSHWHQGYGQEIITTVLNHTKRANAVQKITATTSANNVSSQRLLEKNGFLKIKEDIILTANHEQRPSFYYERMFAIKPK
jgi:ribosomal-protein-alanine N-acetyltransferase